MRKRSVVLFAVILAFGSTPALAAPALSVGLQIDGAGDVISYAGWPLLLEVSFANQGAVNDALHNQAIQAELDALDALEASGGITEADAERIRNTLELRETTPLLLGSDDVPWTELVSFTAADDTLDWPIELLAEDVPSTLVLDEQGAVVVWYGLSAEASAGLAAGAYEIALIISTEGAEPAPEGMWTGTASSAPVRVEIRTEPALTDDLLSQKWTVFGRYELYRGEFARAEAYLLDAVSLDRTSVEAWILLGDAQYAQGRLEDALASYYEALGATSAGETTSHSEPPVYIVSRIVQIEAELGVPEETEVEEP